jgi:hypothetical protein
MLGSFTSNQSEMDAYVLSVLSCVIMSAFMPLMKLMIVAGEFSGRVEFE